MPNHAKKPSELARSAFWKEIYRLQEDAIENRPSFEDLDDQLSALCEKIGELKSDCEEKFESLHDNFKDSSKLPARIEALEECKAALDDIDTEYDGSDTEEARLNWRDEQWQEAIDALNNISCD